MFLSRCSRYNLIAPEDQEIVFADAGEAEAMQAQRRFCEDKRERGKRMKALTDKINYYVQKKVRDAKGRGEDVDEVLEFGVSGGVSSFGEEEERQLVLDLINHRILK